MARQTLIPMVVIALALVAATCAQPTQEMQVTEVPTATEAEPMVVNFMTWGEDQFEVDALEKLTTLFQARYPDIEIKCEIVTTVPVEGAEACTIVIVEGGEQ